MEVFNSYKLWQPLLQIDSADWEGVFLGWVGGIWLGHHIAAWDGISIHNPTFAQAVQSAQEMSVNPQS